MCGVWQDGAGWHGEAACRCGSAASVLLLFPWLVLYHGEAEHRASRMHSTAQCRASSPAGDDGSAAARGNPSTRMPHISAQVSRHKYPATTIPTHPAAHLTVPKALLMASSGCRKWLEPKSMTLSTPSAPWESNMMFSGLRSMCATPREWQWARNSMMERQI